MRNANAMGKPVPKRGKAPVETGEEGLLSPKSTTFHHSVQSHSTVSSSCPRSTNVGESPGQSLYTSLTENAIDSLEKEQEGVVMKLLREIKALQEENRTLKMKLNGAQSPVLSASATTSPRMSVSSSHSSYGNNSGTMMGKRRSTFSDASLRRVPTSVGSKSRSASFSLNSLASPTSSLGILLPPVGGAMEEYTVDSIDTPSQSHKRRSSVYSLSSNSSRMGGHHLFGNYTLRRGDKMGVQCRSSPDESPLDGLDADPEAPAATDAIDGADDTQSSYVVAVRWPEKGSL